MVILIIVLAVILVLGSALWIRPSPREKSQMTMRREAMLKGLQVKLTKIKDSENPGEELHCIAYRLERKREKSLKPRIWMLYRDIRDHNEALIPGWRYDLSEGRYKFEQTEEILMLLLALPADVMAVQATVSTLSVYWNERGKVDDVTIILDVLKRLQSL